MDSNVRDRIRKIMELSKRGVGGESDNARSFVHKLCKKYGVSVQELSDTCELRPRLFKIGADRNIRDLFFQVVFKVTDSTSIEYKEYRNLIQIELSSLDFLEVSQMFDWHKKNYLKNLSEMKRVLLSAYMSKHALFPEHSKKLEVLSDEDYDELRKIVQVENLINNDCYHKCLKK